MNGGQIWALIGVGFFTVFFLIALIIGIIIAVVLGVSRRKKIRPIDAQIIKARIVDTSDAGGRSTTTFAVWYSNGMQKLITTENNSAQYALCMEKVHQDTSSENR